MPNEVRLAIIAGLMIGFSVVFAKTPLLQDKAYTSASHRLEEAISNPEYMLKNWVNLPTSPASSTKKIEHLSLKDAILLALRYNSNIQSAELDRIVQRYQLRVSQNEFELQYALAGSAQINNSQYSGVGRVVNHAIIGTPELGLKTKFGTQVSLAMDNNVAPYGNYNPLVGFTIKQPLLRGFGHAANEAQLLNALDNEFLNKLNLQQSVMDQVTQVITAYRALVVSANHLKNQEHQLGEAKTSFKMNEKKIKAGQMAPTANVQQSYQIESLKLMVEQAKNDFITSTQDLLQTIGLDPSLRLAIESDVIIDKIQIPDVQKAIETAELHNAQFQALKMVIRADERAIEVAKNQQLWQLDASATVQAGLMTGVDNQTNAIKGIYNGNNLNEAAGVTLTIPLHDLNRRQQLIEAKVRLEKDRLNLIAARRALITLIKNTITNIQGQARRYELALRQVDLAKKSYELEKKKQQAGIASSLDVNNTQNQLIQAQIGLISAKISYLNQLSSLQRVLGTTLQAWGIQLRYGT